MTADAALQHPWLRRTRDSIVHQPLDPEVLSSLREFAAMSNFKRTALEAVAFGMSGQSMRGLREQFAEIDKDSAGFVSLNDFCDVLVRGGTSRVGTIGCYSGLSRCFLTFPTRLACCALQDEAVRIFQSIDQGHTNSISYTEFLAASISRRRVLLTKSHLRDAFDRMDIDGVCFLTAWI
jgi:Ca2+-binding EF-hand superfamily protein